MSEHSKNLVVEMSIGVAVYGIVAEVIALIICLRMNVPPVPVLVGLAVGVLADILMLIHIAVITERVLESKDEAYANRTTVVHSLIRKVVFVIALLVLWFVFHVNAVAMIIGAMGLKAGAYLQPLVHKTLRGNDQ